MKFAREHRGLDNIYTCEIEDAPFPDDFFDYINFWHVIEHLRDPNLVLKRILGWLKPNGILNLGTPNPLTPYGWLAYNYHKRFDLGVDHTFGFPPKTLRNTLEQIGFQIQEQKVYKPSVPARSALRRVINKLGLNNTMQKVIAVKPDE